MKLPVTLTLLSVAAGALYAAVTSCGPGVTEDMIRTSALAGRVSGVMQGVHANAGSYGEGDVTARVKAFDAASGPGAAYRHAFGGELRVIAEEDSFKVFFEDLSPRACDWMLDFEQAGPDEIEEEPILAGQMIGPAGIGITSTFSPSGCAEGDLVVTYEPMPLLGGDPV